MAGPAWDLIVVGAGTAGCVLADRLTRSGRLRVLLLEAGGDPRNRFIPIPAGFSRLFRSEVDWALESEPEPAAGGRRIFIPRGRMLGGSANLNAQIHQWCHPADFEGWVEAGAAGWGWDDVAPVFRVQEQWAGEDLEGVRGREGPMPAAPLRDPHPLTSAFVAAARAAGLGQQTRYNGGPYQGAFLSEVAHRNGRRFSAYDAYLKPALRRSNLEVWRDAPAIGIAVEGGRACGVRVRRGAAVETLAAGGVVLAAGSFGSPQLLMLSGIGPAAMLARLGLPVVLDAPEVGENLQDHPTVPVVFRARRADTLKQAESPVNLLRYLLFRRGQLASNVAEAIAFTTLGDGPGAPPDAELLFAPVEWRNEGLDPPRTHAATLAAAVVAPRSRGRVRLASADPQVPPAIDFGLLSDPEGRDAAVLLRAIRLARRIAATPPLAAELEDELSPGPDAAADPELAARLQGQLQTVYHPTSTCRMGSDPRSVVDPRLRVRGVRGLWVADASVMPAVPRGHPNAVVAMIANRAADFITADLGR